MSPPCWVGIDPSYSGYGLVRLHGDDTCHAQKIDFSPGKSGKGSQRLEAIFNTLHEKFEAVTLFYEVKAVALEGYAMGAKWGREMAGELGGITRLLSLQIFKREPWIVPPTSLKKFVTGDYKASKDQMKASVKEKWGENFKSHDIADAYGLARVAKAMTRGTTVEYEREVLTVLKERNAL